jgi:hypothetical protein
MRTPGNHFVPPFVIVSTVVLLAGLHGLAQASPTAAKDEPSKTAAQTQPTQTRPAGKKGSPAPAAASRRTEAKKSPSAGQASEKPLAFTDEDLHKYHSGPSVRSTHPPDSDPTEDPLKSLKDREERNRLRQEKISMMQQKILDLEARVKFLEQKRLSVANPFVPRPQEGSEEKPQEKGLSGPELMAKTDEEIKQTSLDLESARKELAALQQSASE